jgi:hypothetical protein
MQFQLQAYFHISTLLAFWTLYTFLYSQIQGDSFGGGHELMIVNHENLSVGKKSSLVHNSVYMEVIVLQKMLKLVFFLLDSHAERTLNVHKHYSASRGIADLNWEDR